MLTFELPKEFEAEIKKALQAVYLEAMEQARRDATITKDYLSYNEVIKVTLDVSRGTLDKWITLGLPVYAIDGKKYFKRQDLYNFIERYKQ